MRSKVKKFAPICLGAILVSSSPGCLSLHGRVPYKPQIPRLQVMPKVHECEIKTPEGKALKEQCVTLLAKDLMAYVVELQSACVALGNSKKDCGVRRTKADKND